MGEEMKLLRPSLIFLRPLALLHCPLPPAHACNLLRVSCSCECCSLAFSLLSRFFRPPPPPPPPFNPTHTPPPRLRHIRFSFAQNKILPPFTDRIPRTRVADPCGRAGSPRGSFCCYGVPAVTASKETRAVRERKIKRKRRKRIKRTWTRARAHAHTHTRSHIQSCLALLSDSDSSWLWPAGSLPTFRLDHGPDRALGRAALNCLSTVSQWQHLLGGDVWRGCAEEQVPPD